jgi:hypothetical protein
LDFLALAPLAVKREPIGYWSSLDFLGFLRPNPDFSMGYTGFSVKKISHGPSSLINSAGDGASGRGHAETQNCSWGKLNLASIFLQYNCTAFRLSCFLLGSIQSGYFQSIEARCTTPSSGRAQGQALYPNEQRQGRGHQNHRQRSSRNKNRREMRPIAPHWAIKGSIRGRLGLALALSAQH